MTKEEWNYIGAKYKVGQIVEGTVIKHQSYGIFLDIGEGDFLGMIRIIKFGKVGKIYPEDFPPIGEKIRGVVCHLFKTDENLYLSLRPRDFEFYTKNFDLPAARDPYIKEEE